MNDTPVRVVQVAARDRFGGEPARVARSLHVAYSEISDVDEHLLVGRKFSIDPRVLEIPREPRGWLAGHLFDLGCRLQLSNATVRGAWRLGHVLKRLAEPQRVWASLSGGGKLYHPGCRRLLALCSQRPHIVQLRGFKGCFDPRFLPRLSQAVPCVLSVPDAATLDLFTDRSPSTTEAVVRLDDQISKLLRRSAVYVATPSRWSLDALLRRVPRNFVRDYRVIPYGVDQRWYRPHGQFLAREELRLNPEVKVIVASFDPTPDNRDCIQSESLALLRKAVSRAVEELPNRLRILIIGVGSPRRSERMGAAEIRFLHYPQNPGIAARWYQAADLYLHTASPSSFPTMVTEAMACGTPVVAPAVGGIPEQVQDRVEGLLVPTPDADALAQHVKSLLSDDALRMRLGQNGARKAARLFEAIREAKDYLEWYREIRLREEGRARDSKKGRGSR